MRLLDQIGSGRGGLAAEGRAVAACSLRYILDEGASRQCFELIRDTAGLLAPENPFLRLPAERFWIEWLCEPTPGLPRRHRLGTLVEADEGGRAGWLTGFYEDADGEARSAAMRLAFDLDRPASPGASRLHHGTLPHLNRLFGHVAVERLRPAPAGDPGWLRREAETVWFNLPMVLTFAALLASRGVLAERRSDLDRLNLARRRRGRAPLLDHVEVGLALNPARPATEAGRGGGRAMPRLHLVRGHVVRRGEATFWRAAHLRGDVERPIASRTVRVGT